jgi:hypothetical protein
MPHRGCVTNWYQSMVTMLGLLGLMYESVRNYCYLHLLLEEKNRRLNL